MTECSCPSFTLRGESTTLHFPKPAWANPNNSIDKNIKLFNFWDGDIDTVDAGINTQPLTMGGTICTCGIWEGLCFPICFPAGWDSAISCWLDSIETAMNDGEEFEINELGDCLNGVYIVKNFIFSTIKKSPFCFEWSLVLERVRDIA